MRISRLAPLLLWILACQADTVTSSQAVSVAIAALGKVTVVPSIALNSSGRPFSPYRGVLPVNFRVRTSTAGGGRITVQAMSDFAPAGGPSIATGNVQYTCSGATLGTPCSGTQTLSTTVQTNVLAIPAGACTGGGASGCSAADPNTVNLSFTLENSPQYKTGNYSAQIAFTISAT